MTAARSSRDCLFRTMTSPNASVSCQNSCQSHHNEKRRMENGEDREMDLYLYVDGRGRVTMPRALRCRTGMGKNSFVRARLGGGVVRLTHVDASGGRADDRGGAARLHPCVSAASERRGGKTGDAGAVGGSICRGAGCREMLNRSGGIP